MEDMDIKIMGFIVHFTWDNLFQDDDDDEDRNVRQPKVRNYAEEIVPHFSDRQFQMHFRLTFHTFESLLIKLHNIEDNVRVNTGCKPVPLDKQLLVTIWYLSNIESFRSVADRFDISKSTCWNILYKTCNGIIGAIDGCHIHILKPKHNANSYCNRKNFHSVLLQGICDSEKVFLDVYAGEPGSIHDMRLFKKSDFYAGIQDLSVEFFNDSHLVGDLAYKLSPYLLVDFKDVGGLTNRQKQFNQLISQCRVVIENAYAYLKGRFRRLKFLETVRLDLICLLIVSACIIHNMCILNGDMPEEVVNDIDMRDVREYDEDIAEINEEQDNNDGVMKRAEIMNMLPM